MLVGHKHYPATLRDFIDERQQRLKSADESALARDVQAIKLCFLQVLRGLDCLRANGTVHRNLRPENIVVDFEASEFKLSDFRHARSLLARPATFTPEPVRCRQLSAKEAARAAYKAPELLLRDGKCGWEVDLWSAGAIFAEMGLGSRLFEGSSEFEVLLEVFSLTGTPAHLRLKGFPSWPPADLADLASSDAASRQRFIATLTPHRRKMLDKLLRFEE